MPFSINIYAIIDVSVVNLFSIQSNLTMLSCSSSSSWWSPIIVGSLLLSKPNNNHVDLLYICCTYLTCKSHQVYSNLCSKTIRSINYRLIACPFHQYRYLRSLNPLPLLEYFLSLTCQVFLLSRLEHSGYLIAMSKLNGCEVIHLVEKKFIIANFLGKRMPNSLRNSN